MYSQSFSVLHVHIRKQENRTRSCIKNCVPWLACFALQLVNAVTAAIKRCSGCNVRFSLRDKRSYWKLMHDQQLQCVSVFSEVNAWKPQILPKAPKIFLFLAWFPKETRRMQPYCSFVCLSGSPFVGNVKQSRQKCKDLRSIAIPAIKSEIKEQGREEAHTLSLSSPCTPSRHSVHPAHLQCGPTTPAAAWRGFWADLPAGNK